MEPASPFAAGAEAQATPESADSDGPINPFEFAESKALESEIKTPAEAEEISEAEPKRIQLPAKKPTLTTTIRMPAKEDFGFEAKTVEPQDAPKNHPTMTPSAAPNPFSDSSQNVPPTSQSFVPEPEPVENAPVEPRVERGAEGTPASDSGSIKQLELRAIFGVDRELSREEILERAGSLPGIRKIAVATEKDFAAVSSLRETISNLGFGVAPIKILAGAASIEFVKEGGVLLAVQVDGEFGPGVRETLMIVARELSR